MGGVASPARANRRRDWPHVLLQHTAHAPALSSVSVQIATGWDLLVTGQAN